MEKIPVKKFVITGKSHNQKKYIKNIESNRIIFCSGPAGVGKTRIATACGIIALRQGHFKKMILCRPMVEAGKPMGALPGGINDKLEPYIRPIQDELSYYLTNKDLVEYNKNKTIEIVPFAYMKGRNFHETYVVCDEAVDCTFAQIEMLLCRIGSNSKIVIVGDPSQSNLDKNNQGGMLKWMEILKNVPNISSSILNNHDIVRDEIVRTILEAKEQYEKASQKMPCT